MIRSEHVEFSQAKMAGQRGNLTRHALHEVAIARHDPGPVFHDRMSGAVEMVGEKALRNGHSYRVPEPLAQRTGGGLHSRRVPSLGMSRREGTPLPEIPDLFQWEVIAREVEQRIEQHRGVAAGEHEAVTIGPLGVPGIVLEEPGPQDVCGGRERHRGARMSRLRFLYRIHGEGAD